MCCMCDAQSATIKHENVNTFIGLCLVAPNVSIVMLHAHKGCLYDLLQNENLKLNIDFRYSFVLDIATVSSIFVALFAHIVQLLIFSIR